MEFAGACNACQGWITPGAIALLLYHHFAPFCSSPSPPTQSPRPPSMPIFSLLTSPSAVVLQLITVHRLLAVRSLPRRTEQIPP